MLNSTERILNSSVSAHLMRDVDLSNLFQGTPARRYGLINKALKQKELLHLRRGLYVLAPQYLPQPFSLYYLANHISSHSFVTAESALQFHQWIPERVTQTTNMVAFGRNRQFDTPFGQFIYRKTPLEPGDFWAGVTRTAINHHSVLMATPLRALCDYVYWHKIENADKEFLKTGLRIEDEHLNQLTRSNIEELIKIYPVKRVKVFLSNLLKKLEF